VADSIKDVSSKVAKELVSQYAAIDDKGNARILGGYPGVLYLPYYWWQAGAMFGTLLDYWHYTGDNQYNNLVRDGLIHQFGDNYDLVRLSLHRIRVMIEKRLVTNIPQLPANQSKNEGNDDQVFWAFSMIAAAEYKLPDPPPDKPGWLAMTQSVFNQFVERYNREVTDQICGGGMRCECRCRYHRRVYLRFDRANLPQPERLELQKHSRKWRAIPSWGKTGHVHEERHVREMGEAHLYTIPV
jgi:3-methylcrotonyl-CoA carboxylase beta subunit